MAYDSDEGFFHLTADGWVRKDEEPFPEARIETWRYRMHQSSGWSDEKRQLHCKWADPKLSRADRDALRKKFGLPYGFGRDCNDYVGEPL
jgi:hypothetical protein